MRVGLICGHFDPTRDGVADYTRHLAGHLRSAGHQALICTTHPHAAGSTDVAVGVTDRWTLGGVRRAARVLAGLQLDVLHVQFAPSAFGFSRAVGVLPLLLPADLPIVVTLHEYGVWHGGRLRSTVWTALERRGVLDRETLLLAPRADRLLACSPEHVTVLQTRHPHWTALIVPIGPNIAVVTGDQAAQARAAVRAELGMPPDAPLVVFFGFLHPVKGLERLIEAVSVVRPQHAELRLVLAGGVESHSVHAGAATALRGYLQRVARVRGLEHAVTFTGFLPEPEVSRLLLAADAAVFPFNEGVTDKSGSLLATLAHGVPTIATAPIGTPTGVDEADGILRVPPRDTAALADALRCLLSDRALAARLADAGRARVAGLTWSAIAATHVEIYAGVLQQADQGVSR
jgi:glycosyltransferase involved in cell wall biosynthesis